MDNDGKERSIAFVSQKLNGAQRNYTVMELECLPVIISVKHFRQYIQGLPFRIIKDHSSLRWLMGQKDLNGLKSNLLTSRWNTESVHWMWSPTHFPDSLPMTLKSAIIHLQSEFESPEYSKVRDYVRKNSQALPNLCISGNLIYKRKNIQSRSFSPEDTWRLWILGSLTGDVNKNAHRE